MAETVVYHEIVDDINSWRLFETRDLYIIGSITVDQYLIVPETKVAITLDAVRRLDGTQPLEVIQQQLEKRWGKDVDFVSLFLKLRDAGLVKTAQCGSRPVSELLKNSVRLFSIKLTGLARVLSGTNWLFAPLALVIGALLLIYALATFHFATLAALTGLTIHLNAIGQYVGIWVGLSITAAIHEMSHGTAASRFGLQPRSLTVALYLGFIPYIYIRIPGVYAVSAVKRLIIWGAGMYSNVVMIAILWQILLHVPARTTMAFILGSLIWANIGLIAFNLSPFMATDGYFILSTILRTPNIRTRAYIEGSRWLKREKNQFGWALGLYATASLILLVWVTEQMVRVVIATVEQAWHGRVPSALDMWPYLLMLVCIVVQRIWQRRDKAQKKGAQVPQYQGEELTV